MAHTPGPFVFDLAKSPTKILPESDTSQALALVYLTDPKTRKRSPEFEGNAHLFAAAPDMLAALKKVKSNGTRVRLDTRDLVAAVIAKAEGH